MRLFFDTLILIGILSTALPAVILLYHRVKTKKSWEYQHKKFSLIISLLLLLFTTIFLYGSFIEPRMLIINEQTVDLKNIDNPIKIAFFSDSQIGKYRDETDVKRTVEKILKLNPDIVFIGGDVVDNSVINQKKGIDETLYLTPLSELTKRIPVYAINGNHEFGVNCQTQDYPCTFYFPDVRLYVQEKMELLGVRYLVNELEKITVRDQSFYLYGGDTWWGDQTDFSILNKRDNEDIPTIALIHNPAAAWETNKNKIDLMLSGHTHGGQIRLPLVGPVGLVDDIIPRSWYQGWQELDQMKLFVTSGNGETGVRARLFNPPEIVLITIN